MGDVTPIPAPELTFEGGSIISIGGGVEDTIGCLSVIAGAGSSKLGSIGTASSLTSPAAGFFAIVETSFLSCGAGSAEFES